MSSGKYTVYHLHSDGSLLDSASKFKEYVDLAAEQGMTAIASTEHGIPRSWADKKLYCDSKGIKFMHGVEIYLTESLDPKVRDNYHTVLIARNADGVRELNRLIELSSDQDHMYYNNRLSFDEFLGISDNIIKTSACLASPLNALPDEYPRYEEIARHYDFLEVQPHRHEDQIAFNKRLYELSKRIGVPLIAGTDTHNSSAYKAECRKILMKYKKQSYGDEDSFDLTWKTYDELVEMFRAQGALPEDVFMEAIENTNVLEQMVEPIELDTSIKYPILYGSREEDSKRFDELIRVKFQEKLEKGIIPPEQKAAFESAIVEELRVFRKLQMDGFMLSMAEMIGWCKAQGMAIGTARGSVGGSRIAYVTDIIDLNPETWHTVFSRFCNEDRREIGDIDIDVVKEDRPAIFKYITNRFGSRHTARVGSYGTIAELGVIDTVGGAFKRDWEAAHPGSNASDNPWSFAVIDRIKDEYEANPEGTKKKYSKLFYYFDGLLGTRISQSVHPAGIVISPLNLDEEYGVFHKGDDLCLCVDMDELHEVGAAKYDFLVLKTVQVIRDTCRYIGVPYPKTHEINWEDEAVWNDMLRSPAGIFQMEGAYAFDSLKKFRPRNLFDMSLVTACIRPSGASYRDNLLARKPNHNPSKLIDDLLKENNGYLVYQCDVIKFLQQVCGLSGSEADNIRRAIGRKDHDRLEKALPDILKGYCEKSDKPEEEAKQEAMEFLRIIEDASSYMFGYNHSIAYCMLGYLCAYYRYYNPVEFITSFLNNAANEDDIQNGTELARLYGIHITMPKFGISKSNYACSVKEKVIAKGISSLKNVGKNVGDELYELSRSLPRDATFIDVLLGMRGIADSRVVSTLIGIDFFYMFGNQRELMWIRDIFNFFKAGEISQVKKEKVAGSPFEEIIASHSNGLTKSGKESKQYVLLDVYAILKECEALILSRGLHDVSTRTKAKSFEDAFGYMGYTSGREEDRPMLYVKAIYPLKRKSDGVRFGYSIITQSIGSGIESRFTVFNKVFDAVQPIQKGDVIKCLSYTREGKYFTMRAYQVVSDDDFDESEDSVDESVQAG